MGQAADVPGTSHHQARQPFELPDAAVRAPNGKSFSGRRAKVYWLLLETRQRRYQFRVGSELAAPGWVPLWALREPWSGGGQGDRRVRELRLYGYQVDVEQMPGGNSTVYRLRSGATVPVARNKKLDRPEPTRRPVLSGLEIRIPPFAEPGPRDQQELVTPGHVLWPVAATEDGYLADLRAAHRKGRLCSRWTGRRSVTLVFPEQARPVPTFVKPTLLRVLETLGATLVGARQQTLTPGGDK